LKEIRTRDFATRRKVDIDGVIYTVRRLGAGEELRASQMSREADKMADNLRKKGEISKKAMSRLEELTKESLELYIGIFDDGTKDGKHSRKLIEELSVIERVILYNKVFEVERDIEAVADNTVEDEEDTNGDEETTSDTPKPTTKA